MRRLVPATMMVVAVGFLAACRERAAEVSVEETRRVTLKDEGAKLKATSDERFQGRKTGGGVTGEAPSHWVVQPAAQFRLLNYRFGASGKGEVYVTMASGGVLENVNRWLGQVGAAAVDAGGLAGMRKVAMLGAEGVWVEAKGVYRGAMGRPEEPGFAVAGVVAEAGGRLVTVKMTGPEAEVEAEKGALEAFAKSLQMVE